MSNIRMLRNILQNVIKNADDKQIIRSVYKDAKNSPIGMHKMRQTFDPSYNAYLENSALYENPNDKTLIENFANDYYYGNIGNEFDRVTNTKLDSELRLIEDIRDNYPNYKRNKENLNDLPIYRGLNDFIDSYVDSADYPYDMYEAVNKYLYKELYNDDPNELVSALMDGEEYLKSNNMNIPEDYKYDLEKAIKMFGIK